MAQIVLKIKANDGADVLATFTADKIVNNVSTLIGQETTKNSGVNGKTFATGFLSFYDGFLGGKDTKLQSEVEKYNGFMFGATDETGSYSLKLTLTGNNLDKIVIIGDMEANQYPVRAILDEGTEYEKVVYSNDLNWAIAFDNENATHTIHFIKWNRANYNACFTTLQVLVEYLEFDRSAIDSVDSLTQSTSDPSSIQYGILANSGSVSIRDLDGELKEYVEDGIIENSNVPVDIYVNDNKIQTHISTDSEYSEENNILNLNLSNKLLNFKDNYYKTKYLNTGSIYSIFKDVMLSLNYTEEEIDKMIEEPLIYGNSRIGTIKDYMQDTNVESYYFQNTTYQDVLNQICEILQLNLILLDNGDIKLKNARPVVFENQLPSAIKINKYNQISPFKKSIIVKNKYDGINANIYYINANPNDILFSSETITCFKDTTFIGNEPRVNPIIYDVYGDLAVDGTSYCLQFNYELDLSKIDKLIYKNLSNLKIIANCNFQNYKYKNREYTQDEQFETYQPIELKYYSYELPYHSFIADGYADNNYYSAKIEGDKLYIRAQIQCETYIGNLIISNKTYNRQFLQNFIFNITKTTFGGKTSIYNSGKIPYVATNNILLQNETVCKNVSIVNILDTNIKNDYLNGIENGTVDIFCSNMYSNNGTKIKDWSKGEIINIGDIIYFENDYNAKGEQKYWKVTSRHFIFGGSPYLKLEVQNVKIIKTPIEHNIPIRKIFVPDEEYSLDFNQNVNEIYFNIKIELKGEILTSPYYNLSTTQDDYGESVRFNKIEIETVGFEKIDIRNHNTIDVFIIEINWIKYN